MKFNKILAFLYGLFFLYSCNEDIPLITNESLLEKYYFICEMNELLESTRSSGTQWNIDISIDGAIDVNENTGDPELIVINRRIEELSDIFSGHGDISPSDISRISEIHQSEEKKTCLRPIPDGVHKLSITLTEEPTKYIPPFLFAINLYDIDFQNFIYMVHEISTLVESRNISFETFLPSPLMNWKATRELIDESKGYNLDSIHFLDNSYETITSNGSRLIVNVNLTLSASDILGYNDMIFGLNEEYSDINTSYSAAFYNSRDLNESVLNTISWFHTERIRTKSLINERLNGKALIIHFSHLQNFYHSEIHERRSNHLYLNATCYDTARDIYQEMADLIPSP